MNLCHGLCVVFLLITLFILMIWVLGCFLEALGLKSVDGSYDFALPNLGWGLMNLFYCLATFYDFLVVLSFVLVDFGRWALEIKA